jgi:hypothetical protein
MDIAIKWIDWALERLQGLTSCSSLEGDMPGGVIWHAMQL